MRPFWQRTCEKKLIDWRPSRRRTRHTCCERAYSTWHQAGNIIGIASECCEMQLVRCCSRVGTRQACQRHDCQRMRCINGKARSAVIGGGNRSSMTRIDICDSLGWFAGADFGDTDVGTSAHERCSWAAGSRQAAALSLQRWQLPRWRQQLLLELHRHAGRLGGSLQRHRGRSVAQSPPRGP